MGTVADLKCQNCDFTFTLRVRQACWIDEEGNVGMLAQPGPQIEGGPKGKFQTGFYDSKYCVTCGEVYSILRMDVMPSRVKRVQNDKTVILSDAEMVCPQCETILLDFLGVLELSKNRERAFRVVFKRVYVPERELLTCPKCKDSKIELLSYSRI
ncbi:MAG: hypothetical protein ACE5R6_13300 [Candidatus Heimdallarchaeota archaeon]